MASDIDDPVPDADPSGMTDFEKNATTEELEAGEENETGDENEEKGEDPCVPQQRRGPIRTGS